MIFLLLKKKKKVICDRRHALTSGGGSLPQISMQTELCLVQRINNISRKEAHATLGISFITEGLFSATKYYGLLRFDVLR